MRVRPLLIATAIVSSALGAVVVYLVLTVPNDTQAGVLLKQARRELASHKTDEAKQSLSKIVQEYPRTDAAAAATVALIKIADEERARLQIQLDALRRQDAQQIDALKKLGATIEEVKNAPPKVAEVPPPPPSQKPAVKKPPAKKAPAKKAPAKKPAPKKRSRQR